MDGFINAFFEKENINYCRSMALTDELYDYAVAVPRKLPEWAACVTVFLIPYSFGKHEARNVSAYAVPRDYHLFVSELDARLRDEISRTDSEMKTKIFADNSPFYERRLALRAHLGFVGKSGLLINEEYGSFCFVGELVTDRAINISRGAPSSRTECFGCGKCAAHCPGKCFSDQPLECLSELTQRKKLTPEEETLVARHCLAWGCDICQDVCPHNSGANDTPIEFFRCSRTPVVTTEKINAMTDKEFSERAYSWRGRAVILRNISLRENIISENKQKINT